MAKKVLLVLIFVSVFTGEGFAQGAFSIGAGGFFGSDFGGGVTVNAKDGSDWLDASAKIPYLGGGGYFFLDATYVELLLDVYIGAGKYNGTVASSIDGQENFSSETEVSFLNFNVGLFGKYPFAITGNFSLFPLLGAEYNSCISANENGESFSNPGELSAVWFKAGCGMDIAPTEKFFLRFEALYGLRLANDGEKDRKELFDAILKLSDLEGETKTLLGCGLTVRFAAGYKF